MFLKGKPKNAVKDAITVTPSTFPMRSGWGAGLQYWGTGLSLRNLKLWWDSPRLIAGTSAGRRPATVGMCSLMSGSLQQHEATGQAYTQLLARASTVGSQALTHFCLYPHDNPDPTTNTCMSNYNLTGT